MAGSNINDIGNKFFGGGGNTNDLRLATLQLATENGESLEITGGMKLEGALESKPSLENTLVGTFPSGTLNSPAYICREGDVVYIVDDTTLSALDVTNPADIKLMGQLVVDIDVVTVVSGLAYATDTTAGTISIIDVSNPRDMQVLSSLVTGGATTTQLEVSGNNLWAANSAGSGVESYDITNPNNLTSRASFTDPSLATASAIAIKGGLAYVLNLDLSTLVVLDVSTPSAVTLVGSMSYGSAFSGGSKIVVVGNYAHILSEVQYYSIVDISDPTAPVLSGHIAPTVDFFNSRDFIVNGDYTYFLADGTDMVDTLFTIDTSDKTLPTSVATLDLDGLALIVGSGNSLIMADTSNGEVRSYTRDGLSAYSMEVGDAKAQQLSVSGLLEASSMTVSTSLNVGREMSVKGLVSLPGGIDGNLNVTGDLSVDGSLLLEDLSISGEITQAPSEPVQVGVTPVLNGCTVSKLMGDYLYVARAEGNAISIFNVSDRASPVFVGGYVNSGTLNGPLDLQVLGDHLYVACFGSELVCLNVSDKVVPTFVSSYSPAGLATTTNLCIYGDHLYIGGGTLVAIVDISDPSAMRTTGSISDPLLSEPRDIVVVGDHMYVATSASGLAVVDITDKSAPSYVASLDDAHLGSLKGLSYSDGYLFGASFDEGSFSIISIEVPTAPVRRNSTAISGFLLGHGVTVSGNVAYVSCKDGIITYDITNKDMPVLLFGPSNVGQSNNLRGIQVYGNYLYVADTFWDVVRIYKTGGAVLTSLETGSIKVSNAQVGDRLDVNRLYVKQAVTVSGDALVGEDLSIGGNTLVRGNLEAQDLLAGGDASVTGALAVTGALTVTGDTGVSGSLDVAVDLDVAGSVDVVGNIDVDSISHNGVDITPVSGSWTPVLAGATTAGTHSYLAQEGNYSRVGKLVFASFRINLTTVGAATAGQLRITGLPFSVEDVHGSVTFGHIQNVEFSGALTAVASPSGTVINMYQSTSNSAAVALPASAMVGKQPFVIASLTYITGD